MAKARAICTCTHCGAEFEVTAITRNSTEKQNWKEWAEKYYDTCRDCWKKQKNARIAEETEQLGLPQLTGSENQINWAMEIRLGIAKELEEIIYGAKKNTRNSKETIATMEQCYSWIIEQRESRYWIDNRNTAPIMMMNDAYSHIKDNVVEESAAAEAAKAEATMMPQNISHDKVSITISDTKVCARTTKDEDFRTIVKGLGFRWSSDENQWIKKITEYTGSAQERAAELANTLLHAGFPVECFDDDVRRMALEADFAPECRRWVKLVISGPNDGMLSIRIPSDNRQEIYDAARAISPKAIYRDGCVLVPIHLCDLVEDFASIHGFNLSGAASKAISEYHYKLATAERVTPDSPKVKEHTNKLREILESEDAVLPDLMDQ